MKRHNGWLLLAGEDTVSSAFISHKTLKCCCEQQGDQHVDNNCMSSEESSHSRGLHKAVTYREASDQDGM